MSKKLKGHSALRNGPFRINFLKQKIKSLASEATQLRLEEVKWWGPSAHRYELHNHRKNVVAVEARHSLLAYGFLRGLEYHDMEDRILTVPNWDRVESLVKRFSDDDWRIIGQRWAMWREAAESRSAMNRYNTVNDHIVYRATVRGKNIWLDTDGGKAYKAMRKEAWLKEHPQ